MNKIKNIFLFTVMIGAASALAEKIKMTSQELLSRIHSANQEEIKAGEMALKKASSMRVKEYAQKLISDHKKADQLVQDLAKKENIKLTASPMPKSSHETGKMVEHVATNQKLKSLAPGADFDKAYVDAMADGHRDVIHTLSSADTTDPQVKRLVAELLPKLRTHEAMADHLQTDVIKEAR